MMKRHKISICTVCMNRLHHLKKTLKTNIIDNQNYDQVEFVILDYNSNDGLETWIKDSMREFIENGKLIYYRTNDPKAWNPSHSKNIVFKVATGDIICNIWADYYTGKNFSNYVNQMFQENEKIVLTPIDFYKTKIDFYVPGDALGKVCVRKEDFFAIKGFDERMTVHGFEDYDFVNRLEMVGVRRVLIENPEFLKFESHQDSERYQLDHGTYKGIYINYIDCSTSSILLLYHNHTFEMGVLLDNETLSADDFVYAYKPHKILFKYSLKLPGWEMGTWTESENIISLSNNKNLQKLKNNEHELALLDESCTGRIYYLLKEEGILRRLLTFKHFMRTRIIMEINLLNGLSVVNHDYGVGKLFKNFSEDPVFV